MAKRRAQPGNRQPAPDSRIRAAQDFLNTADLEAEADDLASPERARAWLVGQGYTGLRRLTAAEYRRLLEFREALRVLAAANNGAPLTGRDRARLNEILSHVVLRPLVNRNGELQVSGGAGLAGFFGELIETVLRARADGTWRRLKACRRTACRWVFWDASRTRSSTWCTMAICGSREKMKAYRSRQRRSLT